MKTFHTTGKCIPSRHYMVNIDEKLAQIKIMVDHGSYFVMNRARQYVKTTTLSCLADALHKEVSNRIFEMWLYNRFLSEDELKDTTYDEAQRSHDQFIRGGMLNMDLILRKFVSHFTDVYGQNDEEFLEKHGRKLFLLYLKPIINGTGHYYVEAETRDRKRTDVIVDYLGQQFIIEMKIWRGAKYHAEGEQQPADYLDQYHLKKGYLLIFSFNQNKDVMVAPAFIKS